MGLGPLRTLLGGGGLRAPLPDPTATFGHPNACFPNWGLRAPLVIFWLTPWKTLEPAVQGTERYLLFLENLEAHIQENFRNLINDIGGISWFAVTVATDIWQPVDGCYSTTLKRLINQGFFDWLDDDENLEKWYGADSFIATSEKRLKLNWQCIL